MSKRELIEPHDGDKRYIRRDDQAPGLVEELAGRGRAAQQREVGGALQLDIVAEGLWIRFGAHPNTPAMNHRWLPEAASSPSPSR